MKKVFKSFAFIAAITVSLAACSKVEEEQANVDPVVDETEHVYTFALGESAGTKAILGTDANGRFVQWTAGDQLGSITQNSQGYSSITPADGENPATFSIYSKGGLAEGNTINVWFPYRTKYTDATNVTLQIPNEQEQRASDNKFDFKAMPMVAKQVTVTAGMASATDNTIISTIDMVCLGSVINFIVFSSEPSYATEKVKSITFNARNADDSADANIAGSFTKNLTTVDPATESTLTISSFTTGYSSVVTSPRSASAIGTNSANALDLYMIVAPGSYRGTIEVETDAAVYTYNLSSAKNLVRAGFKAFGLDLKKAASRVIPVDCVTLPWTYPTGDASATSAGLSSIAGVTASGLGSDYAAGNAPYQIKLDNSGDYIQVKTDTEIYTVSVAYKMIGGGNTSSLDIYESADGDSWGSAIDNLVISGDSGSIGTVTTTAEFASSSRYVKIYFNKGSNVGIGGITISTFGSSPRISAASIAVGVAGVTNAYADYEIHNFVGSDDVSVKTFTGCVTAAIIDGGRIKYSVGPNYETTDAIGTIVLQSAEAPDKTVNVSQSHDTFTQSGADGSPLTLVIPNNATYASFTITSAVFGWNAAVTPAESKNLTIKTGEETYSATHSGSASASAQTITVNSTTAAGASEQTLGTIEVYRNANSSDPQKITITIKKASTSGGTNQVLYQETFGDNGNNNTAVASATSYTATASMFTDPTSTVVSHYSSDGKVGKNSVNPSSGYTNASGKSAVWYTAPTGNNTKSLFTIDKINISSATSIGVSFALHCSNAANTTINVYYKIDGGSEQTLSFTAPTSNSTWTLCDGSVLGTGSSLKLRFEMVTTAGYTVRLDDIKVTGTK